jgi:hypothetical protein
MSLDNEDKLAWCNAARANEFEHVLTMVRRGIGIAMNPAKATDPYTHDLMLTIPADVKCVRTPLFKARELYGIDPQYAVTLNLKDVQRYEKYPLMAITFDVSWELLETTIGGVCYRVDPMNGVWVAWMDVVRRAIDRGKAKTIEYKARVEDTNGNAKASYVLDLRWFCEILPGSAALSAN